MILHNIIKSIFLVSLLYIEAISVIFASDGIYFHDKNGSINSMDIILKNKDSFYLCKQSQFFIRQGPNWEEGPYEIALINKLSPSNQNNEEFLKKLFEESSNRFVFKLPIIDKSLSVHNKIRQKETGGVIGNYRYFIFNINSNKLEEVSLQDIRQQQKQPKNKNSIKD